jgi:MFS family permease
MIDKLRPLTLGEILDRTAQLYRRNFITFASVSAVPMVATFAVFVPIGVAMAYMGIFNPTHPTPSTGSLVALFSVAGVIGVPMALVAAVVMQVALTKTAIGAHMDQPLRVREALKSAWPRFWRYVWLLILLGLLVGFIPFAAIVGVFAAIPSAAKGFLVGFLVVVLFIAAFVYMVWRWLCYSLAMPACIVEEKTAWQSIKRSNSLSKGTRGRIFVMYLLMFAILIVISIVVDVIMFIGLALANVLGGAKLGPVVTIAGMIIALVGRIAMQALIEPLPLIALVLFYYDQRVRTEGYDIELMMEQAGLTTPVAIPEAQAEPVPVAPIPESPLKPTLTLPFEPGPSPDTVKEQ